LPLPKTGRQVDPIEQDFLDALQRLVDGKPEHKELKARANAGKLKINISNVALEAGRSRTLIALKDCRYPAVREAVRLAQGGKKALPTTYTQLIANLRAEKAVLLAEKRLLETALATHVRARRRAEVNARRDAAEAARLRKQIVELEKTAYLPRRDPSLPRLMLIRGLPGTGKTTKAKGYVNDGYRHFEADQFFVVDGEYRFDADKLPAAHAWCLDQTRKALGEGEFVCVANVFATVEDIKAYTELGVSYRVIETNHPGQSAHKVPKSALRAMAANWLPTDRLLEALQSKSRTAATVTSISSWKDKS
jgi:hypothetical protein